MYVTIQYIIRGIVTQALFGKIEEQGHFGNEIKKGKLTELCHHENIGREGYSGKRCLQK